MRYFLFLSTFLILFFSAHAQITITSADMPVAGDTLRFSNVSPVNTGINTSIAGGGIAWNYVFTPLSQAVDTYQSALAVNPLYAVTVGLTAFGYKIADSIPGLGAILPVSIQQLYNFFELKSGPERFEVKAFGASVAGLPIAANYSPPDIWYFLPLAYHNTDSSDYMVSFGLATLGSLKEQGYRKTTVDGWGTIQTPYYTTPAGCLRVRSEIHEIDSITFSGTTLGVPRNSVEYKWLVSGDHYPALWVTASVIAGNEIITGVKYRDKYISSLNPPDSTTSGLHALPGEENTITAYPVPAVNGKVTLFLPAGWLSFVVEVFDTRSAEVAVYRNERELNMVSLPSGQYIARITSGDKTAFVRIIR